MVAYRHAVTNIGSTPDVKEISAYSSHGWSIGLFAADGATLLADSNHNGTADTGQLQAGQSTSIVIKMSVPPWIQRGTEDLITVLAGSAAAAEPANSDTARDETTVNGVITVSVSTPSIDFRTVSPTGSLEPGLTDMSSSTDDLGAYYVKSEAVRVTVSSNSAWTGDVRAQENTGTASTIRIADGDLQWHLDGDQGWIPFDASSNFARGSAGTSSYGYDYRLHVAWEDDPGSFASVVTYNVTQ